MKLDDLASRMLNADKPDILKFSVCTIAGRKGYSWGRAITDDEATIRLLCDMWNARVEIAAAIRSKT